MTEHKTEATHGALKSIRFHGMCELVEEAGGHVLEIYSSIEDALSRGVPAHAARVIFAALGGKPGACINNPKPAGSHDCISVSCTGTCHVFSYPRGPVNPAIEPTDEGIGPVGKVAGRFYWCSCT